MLSVVVKSKSNQSCLAGFDLRFGERRLIYISENLNYVLKKLDLDFGKSEVCFEKIELHFEN